MARIPRERYHAPSLTVTKGKTTLFCTCRVTALGRFDSSDDALNAHAEHVAKMNAKYEASNAA